jgi:hypothetical protein
LIELIQNHGFKHGTFLSIKYQAADYLLWSQISASVVGNVCRLFSVEKSRKIFLWKSVEPDESKYAAYTRERVKQGGSEIEIDRDTPIASVAYNYGGADQVCVGTLKEE